MTHKLILTSSAAILALAIAMPATAFAQAGAPAATEDRTKVETVIVTARKTTETLISAPVAVTLTSKALMTLPALPQAFHFPKPLDARQTARLFAVRLPFLQALNPVLRQVRLTSWTAFIIKATSPRLIWAKFSALK
jgi:hypothetical protein